MALSPDRHAVIAFHDFDDPDRITASASLGERLWLRSARRVDTAPSVG
jgi:hypothetical protein